MKVGTAAELGNLLTVADYLDGEIDELPNGTTHPKMLRKLHEKLTKKKEAPDNCDIRALQTNLVATSNGKVVSVQGSPSFWAIWSKAYTSIGADPQDGYIVGKWLGNQGWLTAVYTVDSLYRKWPNYLARAKHDHIGKPEAAKWAREEFRG